MTIKDFKYISKLDSGSTTYETDLINYFKIDTDQTLEQVSEDLQKAMKIENKEIKRVHFFFKKKLWKICIPLSEETFDQWTRLESIISEENNAENLNRLLAIYLRPVKWYGKVKKFNLSNQEKIEEDLLDLDMDLAQSIMVFFSMVAYRYMMHIKIYFLNQAKIQMMESTQNK